MKSRPSRQARTCPLAKASVRYTQDIGATLPDTEADTPLSGSAESAWKHEPTVRIEKKEAMATETITITVDADAAKSFCEASPEERGKLELLLRLRLRELTLRRVRPLKEIMDEIGADAEAQGLTPEMLGSMLRDE